MNLKSAREEIEKIDLQIISLIKKREECAHLIHNAKKADNISVVDKNQRETVLKRAEEKAITEGLNPIYVKQIFSVLIEMNEEKQKSL